MSYLVVDCGTVQAGVGNSCLSACICHGVEMTFGAQFMGPDVRRFVVEALNGRGDQVDVTDENTRPVLDAVTCALDVTLRIFKIADGGGGSERVVVRHEDMLYVSDPPNMQRTLCLGYTGNGDFGHFVLLMP